MSNQEKRTLVKREIFNGDVEFGYEIFRCGDDDGVFYEMTVFNDGKYFTVSVTERLMVEQINELAEKIKELSADRK